MAKKLIKLEIAWAIPKDVASELLKEFPVDSDEKTFQFEIPYYFTAADSNELIELLRKVLSDNYSVGFSKNWVYIEIKKLI